MAVVRTENYTPPRWLFNGHLQTIYPALFRRVSGVNFQRERISTPDADFLDLDWSRAENSKHCLVIISHGLEGNSTRAYAKGMVKQFNKEGWDALAWNFRGCGQEINKNLRFYHSGATDDLECVIGHAISKGYRQIVLIGFSLGGNMTLKFLGEKSEKVPEQVKKAVVFSVPLDLNSSCGKLMETQNMLYEERFLRALKRKVRTKAKNMPGRINTFNLKIISSIYEFDDLYTAPIHGFRNAEHYYRECSSINFLDTIQIPTLIVNAQNDPILSLECFPYDMLEDHPNVFLQTPRQGGHCGFKPGNGTEVYWSEKRASEFVNANNF